MGSERISFSMTTLALLFIWQILVGPQTMVVRSQVAPTQDAKASKTQGDEAGGIEIAEKHRTAIGRAARIGSRQSSRTRK